MLKEQNATRMIEERDNDKCDDGSERQAKNRNGARDRQTRIDSEAIPTNKLKLEKLKAKWSEADAKRM